MNVLILSNGYGEDKVGSKFVEVIKSFKENFNFWIMPVVGMGQAYRRYDEVHILGPHKVFPSGGFLRHAKDWCHDLKLGLLKHHWQQIKVLKRLKLEENIDVIIVIGDIFLLLLSWLGMKKKAYFLPTAKSNYFQKHFWIEKFLMKKLCLNIFPRDELTTKDLMQSGVKTKYLGNVLMDIIDDESDEDIKINPDKKVIAILPGSRDEAYENLRIISEVIDCFDDIINSKNLEVSIYMALPASLDQNRVAKIIKNGKIALVKGKFKTILEKADLVLGLAGTANEQAVGLGKPVIAFEGYGAQTTKKRFIEQEKLLGLGLIFIEGRESKEIASKMLLVLTNEKLLLEIKEKAKVFMNEEGAIKKIAKEIVYGTL